MVSVSTEPRYPALAYETGIFNAALGIHDSTRMMQGLFGKMNLPTGKIGLEDDQGTVTRVELRNVQFDLDYCLETSGDTYMFEAKTDNTAIFSLLQLFYLLTIVRDLAEQTGKKTHTILVKIETRPDTVTYTFHEHRFRDSSIANSAVKEGSVRVELQIGSL